MAEAKKTTTKKAPSKRAPSFDKLTPTERSAMGKKGAKASNIAQRKKKLLRETFEILLELPIKDEIARAKLSKIGIDDEEMTQQTVMALSILQQAQKGNAYAASMIRDTMGQKNVERLEIQTPIKIVIENDYGDDDKKKDK